MALLVEVGLDTLVAYLVAYLVAVQVSFLLAAGFTWRDRLAGDHARRGIGQRWLVFHVAVSGAAASNFVAFLIARRILPDGLAAIAGIIAGAGVNFILQDRLAFRRSTASPVLLYPAGDTRAA